MNMTAETSDEDNSAKLGPYRVHPVLNCFPMLEGDELDALAYDIKHRGLQEPITITADGSTLVDGRNRYRACDMLDIEPLHHRLGEWYTDDMIRDHIISANLRRQHLPAGQRAALDRGLKPANSDADTWP